MLRQESSRLAHLGVLTEDHVIICFGNKAGDANIITINCPDRPGLACDVAISIFEFGLNVVQADFSIDGRWCLLILWVTPRRGSIQSIQWDLLKKGLIADCSSPSSMLMLSSFKACAKKNNYMLQTCSPDRIGLLNDIAHTLRRLELEVLKVNSLTSPSGTVVNVFLISDIRSEPQDERQETICDNVKSILGASHTFCELSLATSVDYTNETIDLDQMLYDIPAELVAEHPSPIVDTTPAYAPNFSLNIDNSLSPRHTVLHLRSCDRRGLLYDCLRALKDLNLQIAYGRLTQTPMGFVAFDLFVSQANGTKLLELEKQRSLQARLSLDMCDPIRVMIINRGQSIELLVAVVLAKCGRARPHILDDVTLVLKNLEMGIFKASNEKLYHGDRIWELYRFSLVDRLGLQFLSIKIRNHVVERVKNALFG